MTAMWESWPQECELGRSGTASLLLCGCVDKKKMSSPPPISTLAVGELALRSGELLSPVAATWESRPYISRGQLSRDDPAGDSAEEPTPRLSA